MTDNTPPIIAIENGLLAAANQLDDALQELAQLSSRLAQVIECRFFAGYDVAETARAPGLTDRTVCRP